MNIKKHFSLLCLLLSLVMVLSASVFAHGHESEDPPVLVEGAEPVELSDWDGAFNSMTSYLDAPELQATLEEHAKEHGESVDEVKAEFKEHNGADFEAMEVEGNVVRFYDGQIGQGKLIAENEYAYDSTYSAKFGNHSFEWYVFKATAEDALHPYLVLMPLHGEETLAHFHMRYGTNVDEIFAKQGWFPTFVNATTTAEQMTVMFEHEHGDEDHDHDHEHEDSDEAHDHDHEHEHEHEAVVLDDINLSDWEGTWNNMGAYLKSPELTAAFETLAKNEGKDLKDARAAYKVKRLCEFDGFVVEGNSISFLDGFAGAEDTDVLFKNEYQYKESYKVQHGNFELEWHVFVTEDEGARYPVVMLMSVHGEESLTHFHMRYGRDVDELLEQEGWYPTFIKPESTMEQLAAEITE